MAFFFAVRNGSGPALRWSNERIDAVAAELAEPAARCAGYVVPVTPSTAHDCGVFGIALHSGGPAPQGILDVLAEVTPDLEFSAPAATSQGPFRWPGA